MVPPESLASENNLMVPPESLASKNNLMVPPESLASEKQPHGTTRESRE